MATLGSANLTSAGFTEVHLKDTMSALGIPYAPGGFYVAADGMGTVATAMQVNPTSNILDNVIGILNAMSAAILTELMGLLTQWKACYVLPGKMEDGGVGQGVNGMSMSMEEQRRLIREEVRNIVPVFKLWEAMERRQGQAPGQALCVGTLS